MIWEDSDTGNIKGKAYDENRDEDGSEFDIAIGDDTYRPMIEKFEDGSGYIVVWEADSLEDQNQVDVYGQRLNLDFSPNGSPFLVSTSNNFGEQ